MFVLKWLLLLTGYDRLLLINIKRMHTAKDFDIKCYICSYMIFMSKLLYGSNENKTR